MDDWNWCSPVALTTNQPRTNLPVDLPVTFSSLLEGVDDTGTSIITEFPIKTLEP